MFLMSHFVAFILLCWHSSAFVHDTFRSIRLATFRSRVIFGVNGPYLENLLETQDWKQELPRLVSAAINGNSTFISDIFSVEGEAAIRAIETAWPVRNNTRNSKLFNATFELKSISQLASSQLDGYTTRAVSAQWAVTFVPESLVGLVELGTFLPGWRVTYFDILDKEKQVSSFSWKALWQFLERAIFTGEVRIPHAVIRGNTQFTFILSKDIPSSTKNNETPLASQWVLLKQKESLNLVQSINRGTVKNRRLVNDVLEFLDSQRPMFIDLNTWNDLIIDTVKYKDVQGMKQFDIDGLSGERQSQLLSTANNVIGFATIAFLVLGLLLSTAVMNKVFLYQEQTSQLMNLDIL